MTHPNNIINSNFLAGAHKVSFVNLQEYDIQELRAIYSVLPPYFNLDSTPGAEHQKKHWREAFVTALKDLVAKQELGVLAKHEARHGAYFYPSAQEVAATRAKWSEARERAAAEAAKLPALREAAAASKAEYDKVTCESREAAIREILSKETLREWLRDAKADMTRAAKALALVEDKVKRAAAEEASGAENRRRLEELFTWCEAEGKLGQVCFSDGTIFFFNMLNLWSLVLSLTYFPTSFSSTDDDLVSSFVS